MQRTLPGGSGGRPKLGHRSGELAQLLAHVIGGLVQVSKTVITCDTLWCSARRPPRWH